MSRYSPEQSKLDVSALTLSWGTDNPQLSFDGAVSRTLDLGPVRVAMAGNTDVLRDFGTIQISDAVTAPTDQAVAKKPAQVKPPRLDNFNSKAEPADHMRCNDAEGVCGSGRIVAGEQNMLGIVALAHRTDANLNQPNMTPIAREQALRAAAGKTAIVDFRAFDDPTLDKATLATNNKEMTTEMNDAKALGVTYLNFSMDSHEVQTPDRLQTIVDAIDKESSAGKKVSIHCYHGTDRTGLVLAAYDATHDARLVDLLKNHGQKGVEDAYGELRNSLIDSGVEPSTHGTIFQSLRQYLQFQHDGKDGNVVTPVTEEKIDPAQQTELKAAHGTLSQSATMDEYKAILKRNIAQFDPATHGPFYRQLYTEFNRDYIDQHTDKP